MVNLFASCSDRYLCRHWYRYSSTVTISVQQAIIPSPSFGFHQRYYVQPPTILRWSSWSKVAHRHWPWYQPHSLFLTTSTCPPLPLPLTLWVRVLQLDRMRVEFPPAWDAPHRNNRTKHYDVAERGSSWDVLMSQQALREPARVARDGTTVANGNYPRIP